MADPASSVTWPSCGKVFRPGHGLLLGRLLMDRKWTLADSVDLYLIDKWGSPYFSVNKRGNLAYQPNGPGKGEIDFKELVDDLCRRGIQAPMLLRFNDILRS